MIAQVISILLFAAMFVLLILEKFERHIIIMVGGTATLLLVFGICMRDIDAIAETLSLHSFFQLEFWYQNGTSTVSAGINWETIVFVAGMMIMVEGMADSGFFRWLCIEIARWSKFRTKYIFVAFMLLSAVLSMFIDSITVIMFLAAATVELTQILKADPVPFVLAEIFCANLGGAATMCGDPPNIIIGTSLGYSFMDFLSNTGVMVLLSAVVVIPYFYLQFRKSLETSCLKLEVECAFPDAKSAIAEMPRFLFSVVIFFCAVVLLITHSWTGLTVSSVGILIALFTIITAGTHAKRLLMRVDYKTLLFFIGLFMAVSGLEHTGALEFLASLIQWMGGGSATAIVLIIVWASAVASAFIDNIPFAATMIPVIKALSATQGIDLHTLAWALSMGTDIGGSATPIGASANVVGTAIAAKCGYPVTWRKYCRIQAPVTIWVLLIVSFSMLIRYL